MDTHNLKQKEENKIKRRILGPATPTQQVASAPVQQVVAPPVMPPAPPVAVQAIQAPPLPPAMPTIAQQIEQVVVAPPTPVQQVIATLTPSPTQTLTVVPQSVVDTRQVQNSGNSPLHALDMGTEDVSNLRQIPRGVWIEAEITKSEMKTSQNGNPMISLQLKTTWPNEYVGCVVWDKVTITQAAAWKYKSVCAACVDEEGNRLLSEDNRRFTGKSEQDFVGNIVRFRSDEANIDENGSVFNKVAGGYQQAFETIFEEEVEEIVISGDNGNVPVTAAVN